MVIMKLYGLRHVNFDYSQMKEKVRSAIGLSEVEDKDIVIHSIDSVSPDGKGLVEIEIIDYVTCVGTAIDLVKVMGKHIEYCGPDMRNRNKVVVRVSAHNQTRIWKSE